METHEGKSVPVVKEFQIESSWAPVTPLKPTLAGPRPIYEDGQGGLISQAFMRESEDFLSSFTHPNQAQTLLSCSISSAERSTPNNHHNNNNIWSTHGRINLQRENGEFQRRGLESYLPHWSSQGRRTMPSFGSAQPAPSSFPSFSSWDSPLSQKNYGDGENARTLELNSTDPFARLENMSFRDLLAMKGSPLEPSMVLTRMGDDSGTTTDSFFHGWGSQPEGSSLNSHSAFRNQEAMHDLNQEINGICGQEKQNSPFPRQQWSFNNVSTPPRTKHADGKNSTLAPLTPDLQWRAESTLVSENTNLRTLQKANEPNGSEEHEVANAMVNLQSLNNKEVTGSATDSPGKVSMAVEENHNPDQGSNYGIDLNQTPQKKPRRKRYLPKVVSENKPKRTPKPRTPKSTDSKETPRTKRKYVRKNKTNTPSMTPAGAAETIDPKPTEPAVKSCRRSLNFNLNGQVTESNSLPELKGDLYADTQANKCQAPTNHSSHTVCLRQGEEVMVETAQVGIAYDLNRTLHQDLKDYIDLPEQEKLGSSHPEQAISTKEREKAAGSLLENGVEEPSRTDLVQSSNSSPCASSNEGVRARGPKRARSSSTDTPSVDAGNVAADHRTFCQPNPIFLRKGDIHEIPKIRFPEICKKKRTDKGQRSHTSSTSSSVTASEEVSLAPGAQNHPRAYPTTSKYYYCNPAPYGTNAVTNGQVEILMRSAQNRVQLFNTWLDISRLKRKKRSKGTTRVRDLAPLKGIASSSPAKPAAKSSLRRKTGISNTPDPGNSVYINQLNSVHSCLEVLAEENQGTPGSKRKYRKQRLANSRTSKLNKSWDLVLYDGNQSIRNTAGSIPVLPFVKTISLEEVTERLQLLDINREDKISYQEQNALVPYRVNNQEHNALVPYRSDGTLVPFEGPFDPVRKRRQRAKVDLDDETTRVWRLLLENIDNEGIDGTDEQKTKWWENERGVFRGRVDSFIARMRLVQGDRRFTPWKGSVLDSVIGVFLTQNVSDHLSSSAFMSLAARFPIKSESSSTLSEEATSALVVDSGVCIIEPEESITWNEKSFDPPICDKSYRTIHEIDNMEEKEAMDSKEMLEGVPGSGSPVDYSSESSPKAANESEVNKINDHTAETEAASFLRDDGARDDATSSQQSVISSQNSVNSPNLQKVGIMSTFTESKSRAQSLATSSQCHYTDCSTSFMGLLKMAESPLLYDSYSQMLEHDQPECMKHVTKNSPDASGISLSDYQLHHGSGFHIKATSGIELLEVESRSSNTSRKDEISTTELSNLTTESTMQPLVKEKDCAPRLSPEHACSCYVLEGEKMVIQSRLSRKNSPDNAASSAQGQTSSIWKSPNLPNSSQEPADVTESTTALDRENNDHKEVEQISEHNYTAGGIDVVNANSNNPKKGRATKDKRNAYDWDSLRKQVQVNGRKKERTPNTRDSLDWEKVRHADVSEIADTIRERGMNNMLAERIKDLLDRLVKEHGSIDLEWLRDIPPDKAKEYLLSFRGLGLKSVECVRLLTLHHLAFPVDTNVGRIAVRLGWVPLQPLPESLQLHLLELYPILESIQKYLWPRLCKLDQKTLYELHYHMITFGKVFCTKRQPNCNACPLRGECRHFASAFASARLALPGPEERSIVASRGGSSIDPQVNINLLPLPPSWSNHHSEMNFGCNKNARLIEVPYTPLSLPLPQTIHHLERKPQVNCEPIVEVPASPGPEQEQTLCDIEDAFYEDPDEIPTIKLNMKEFSQTLQNIMQANGELQEREMSRALVALTPEAASIPTPKLKNISRLRTEHHVYELPDTHPLLKGMDKREPDDPCSYLLAIWTPGETANSIQPPEKRCNSDDPSVLCNEETCSYCSSQREVNCQIVRGTLLIPCRTAMRGSFPLNGTYFQVNEVFADHDSSLNPINVPRSWLWNLPRRTVYFGSSIPTIFRGLTTEDIQHCFWRGYVCVRGFDQKTRAPRPLMARLHFPTSKMPKGVKGKAYDE